MANETWTANGALVPPVRSGAVATRVNPFAGRSTRKSAKDAIPSTAATLVAPRSAAPLGFDPKASVTVSVAPGIGLPSASATAMRTGGEIGTLASTLSGGSVTKISRAGA